MKIKITRAPTEVFILKSLGGNFKFFFQSSPGLWKVTILSVRRKPNTTHAKVHVCRNRFSYLITAFVVGAG